jgi:hypothetical protein
LFYIGGVSDMQEHRLRVFENRVLKGMFGPKKEEGNEGCRKLHNDKVYSSYFSSDIIRMIKSRRMRWTGHVARLEKKRNAYKVLFGKPEGKVPIRRLQNRWEDNIKVVQMQIKYRMGLWTGFIWLRIRTSGWLL